MSRMNVSLTRLIDANANRAREGARVLEDVARFALNDAALAGRLRAIRHGLEAAVRALPGAATRLAARASDQDVGREDYGGRGARTARASLRDLVAANARRLQEATRVLEESARTLGADRPAAAIQKARFDAYTIEQRLSATLPPARALPDPCLYVLATRAVSRGPLERAVQRALDGGAAAIQLREKELPDREFLPLATRLRRLAERSGALFLVDDRVDVALAAGAHGVHLGPDDLPLATARALLGPEALLGATCHTLAQARRARAEGADYVSMGPVFSAATKFRHLEGGPIRPPVLRATGLESVRRIARSADLPFVAIGGITPENVSRVARAGARRIAVCAGVIAAADPAAAARNLLRALRRPAAAARRTR